MIISPSNHHTKLRTNPGSKKMEEEENEGVRTVECLRGRLLAERQVSRSVKEEADLITKKMEELERNLKEEIRLREKAEKRLKYLMRKLEFIKGSRGSEKLSSSSVSCLSSVCSSTSKEVEEEEENQGNRAEGEDKTDEETKNVASMEEDSKLKDISCGEASVVTSNSSQEEETQAGNDFSWYSDTT